MTPRHTPRIRVLVSAAVAMCAIAAPAACSDSSKKESGKVAKAATSTTVPKFSGSPDSEVCQLMGAIQAGGEADKSPETLRGYYQRLFSLREQLISAAPPEVRHDMELFIDGYHQIDQALAAVNYDRAKLPADKLAIMDDPQFLEAATRLGEYWGQVCKPAEPSNSEDGAGSSGDAPSSEAPAPNEQAPAESSPGG